MSLQLATHAEIVKIAHLLQVDPAEIEYLAASDPDTLIALRMQMIELFYGDENTHLKRFAKVGNLLPASVIASLTREAVGPLLAARIAGFVDAKQAANVVSKLPVSFVVDIATAIDPRRVGPVVGRLDNEFIDKLTIELIRREEYVTMGQFVGFANEEALRSAFKFASDDALLRIAFVAEDKDRISVALAPQTDERIASIIVTAIANDLWPEAMDLFTQLSDEQYVRVINIAGALPPKTLDKLISQTTEHETWPILVPAVAQMEDPNRACEALLRADQDNLRAFVDTVSEDNAFEHVAVLVRKLNAANLMQFSLALIELGDYEILGRFIGLATDEVLAKALEKLSDEELLKVAVHATDKERVSAALAMQDDKRINSLIKAALKQSIWAEVLELFTELEDEQYMRLINLAGKLPPQVLDQMISQTTKHECWPLLVPAIAQTDNPNRACEALLRADAADVRAFATTVIEDKAWEDAEELIGKLSDANRDELLKRLTRLKLAEGFVQVLPMMAA